jgi:hypothetical protein
MRGLERITKGTTTFAFVAINHGLELGNWKDINKDFTKKEDSIQKIKFERFILNPVKANVSRRVVMYQIWE